MDRESKALAAALANETADQQRHREFITELFNNVRDSLIEKIPKMSAEWDGHELRRLALDHLKRCQCGDMQDRRSKRYRDYEAICLTQNLY